MSETSERKFEVSILVDSEEYGQGELASMLTLSADEGWDKGDEYHYRGGMKARAASRWSLVERDGDIEDWGTTVARLIGRLRPIESAFRRLPASVYVRLMICMTEDSDVFGFGLDKHQVEFIASIGAELDMSFVVRASGRPAERHGGRDDEGDA